MLYVRGEGIEIVKTTQKKMLNSTEWEINILQNLKQKQLNMKKILKNKKLIVRELFLWAETFDMELDEEGEKTDKTYNFIWGLAKRLQKNQCTKKDYKDILFHIWQINYNEVRIRL